MMRCVEIVNSAKARIACLNVTLDLPHSMLFLHIHDNCFTFHIQLVPFWLSNNIQSPYLLVTCVREEDQNCDLDHVPSPASSSLPTFPLCAFQGTLKALRMIHHSNFGDMW
jgi:hypothetical protein